MTKQKTPGFLQKAVSSCATFVGSWAGLEFSGTGDGFDRNLDGVPRTAEGLLGIGCMNQTTAMQLSAVWACVTLLSDTISTLPLALYQRKPDGTRVVADDHPLHQAMKFSPNPDQTPSRFMGAFVASMLLRDGGFAEKLRFNGKIVGYRSLSRDCLNCTKENGKKVWRYTEDGKARIIPTADLWRVPGFTLNGYDGCSAIKFGSKVFSAAKGAETAASGTFLRGLLPTTFFKFPKILKPDQRDDARRLINNLSGAVNSGLPVILEADMEAGQLGINPVDAQLLESRRHSAEEICSWFRVQPFMIGRASQGQTNWGTGIEQQMIGFITFTLRPWLKRIEESIAADLLTPAERATYYAEFNLEGLLRGDSAARSAFYQVLLQNGILSRNEVRRLENLPPIEGGDVYTVQANLIPITQLGKEDATGAATVRNAFIAWMNPDGEKYREAA